MDNHRTIANQIATDYASGVRSFTTYGDRLSQASLVNLDLNNANFCGANLAGANLFRANLSGCNFHGAVLRGASLMGANLKNANLQGAYLDAACFYRAVLSGANLTEAHLVKANLLQLVYDTTTCWESALFDEHTQFNSNFDPHQLGMIEAIHPLPIKRIVTESLPPHHSAAQRRQRVANRMKALARKSFRKTPTSPTPEPETIEAEPPYQLNQDPSLSKRIQHQSDVGNVLYRGRVVNV